MTSTIPQRRYTSWNPLALAPHWNWRGGADFGTFLDGGAKTCVADASHCVLVQWQAGHLGIGSRGFDPSDVAIGHQVAGCLLVLPFA